MSYASRSGRAYTNPSSPDAFGVCQRCGFWHNRKNIRDQWDWRGTRLQNLYILVCPRCVDNPQQQLRAIVLPADPVPIYRPLQEPFNDDEP